MSGNDALNRMGADEGSRLGTAMFLLTLRGRAVNKFDNCW